MKFGNVGSGQRLWCAGLMLTAALGLAACGAKEKKSGQALASVNGEEITVLQLNEEMQRSGVQAAQQETARKQLLEALIDRQLLQNEAAKDKVDRDPKVVQAIERAKALIVAQAYMQKRIGTPARPGKEEVEAYYKQHPEFFAQRKTIDMKELVVASADLGDDLKGTMDSAKSLDEVAGWLDAHKVKYSRTNLSRATSDLPSELTGKLLSLPKGQLFIIKEAGRALLIAISDVHESPVTLEVAAPQIEQFLFNKKNKDAADAELARLRAAAKIDYLDKSLAAPAAASASASASAPSASGAADANARGVAGLK
ncbi:EpsD family peptidyl-prolyl cis-trans isomerase [Rugamonas apoptosis]|uniref:EpsD family peptidyl-prolyl cis-trans isomerase n=1 Tax=Rugamonas apoptosis TaxID=2758570 RepID=UPI002882D42A|nr:EpsD family peptidyl-prolyl cis-trans isomerase [Rugamonas apoptosis]